MSRLAEKVVIAVDARWGALHEWAGLRAMGILGQITRRLTMNELGFDLQTAHKHFSASCFNAAWDLIDKPERSVEDEERMLQLAVASAWHGSQREDCTDQSRSIAYWQISRIHAICERGAEAVRYGTLCLAVSQGKDVAPFALAYAYEALARGESVSGNPLETKAWLAKAHEVVARISDDETQKMLRDDLATIAV